MKQTPEQQPDLFDPREEKPVPKPIKMYPPDLNVRESTGYIRPTPQSREQIISQSNEEEVLSPHETHDPSFYDEDFKYHDPREFSEEDLQELGEVVRKATKEDDK